MTSNAIAWQLFHWVSSGAYTYRKPFSFYLEIMPRYFLIFLVLFFSILLPSAYAQTGLTFLQVGTTAREQAMANTGVASARGAAANYYNAALLNSGETSSIVLSQSLWLLDTYSSYAAANFNYGNSALGVALLWLTVSDIPIRTRATESPEGTFAAQNLALSASYAYSLNEQLSIALTGKFLYERIFIDDAVGVAFDISGAFLLFPELRLAAALQHIGTMNELASEVSRLPTLLRAGAAYSWSLSPIDSRLLLEANIVTIFSDATQLKIGAEFEFRNFFWIRAGLIVGNDSRALSAGAGIKWSSFTLDYAFVPFFNQLGSANVFSLHFQY
jgi:hypothetical protein